MIFRSAKGAAGVTDGETTTDCIVFRVTDIVVPPFDAASAEAKRVVDILQRSLTEELIAQYMTRLQTDIGVSVNQNAFNLATGAAASN